MGLLCIETLIDYALKRLIYPALLSSEPFVKADGCVGAITYIESLLTPSYIKTFSRCTTRYMISKNYKLCGADMPITEAETACQKWRSSVFMKWVV